MVLLTLGTSTICNSCNISAIQLAIAWLTCVPGHADCNNDSHLGYCARVHVLLHVWRYKHDALPEARLTHLHSTQHSTTHSAAGKQQRAQSVGCCNSEGNRIPQFHSRRSHSSAQCTRLINSVTTRLSQMTLKALYCIIMFAIQQGPSHPARPGREHQLSHLRHKGLKLWYGCQHCSHLTQVGQQQGGVTQLQHHTHILHGHTAEHKIIE